MTKKKSARKPKNLGEAVGFHNKLSSEVTDFLLGLVLLCLSVCVIIAYISYFSTGAADQSILEDLRPGEWLNTGREFANYGGSLGAIISYILIDRTLVFPLSSSLHSLSLSASPAYGCLQEAESVEMVSRYGGGDMGAL